MATILTRAGYEVLTAGSGAEALATLQERAEVMDLAVDLVVDLVVLDGSMPGMTGRQTYERMRALPQRPRVVFISGYTSDMLEGLAPGREWGSLPKPFDAQALVGEVRGLLAGAREAEAA